MEPRFARPAALADIGAALARSPVVVMTGPRQCGKTTLIRELLAEDSPNYFDLEDPASLARLGEPMTALRPLQGLVVIDEIQRLPDLFPILRVLADRRPRPARFLILGSASRQLLRQSSESLAGRAEWIRIGGFTLAELGAKAAAELWRPAVALRSFWTMLAHYHGHTWNAAEPARALGVNESTTRRYLDLFTDALMIRQLHPWHANLARRPRPR